MARSLFSLTDSLAEGVHEGKCKDFESSLEDMAVKDCILRFKCVDFMKTDEKNWSKFIQDIWKHILVLWRKSLKIPPHVG